jgi:hypothetical protein
MTITMEIFLISFVVMVIALLGMGVGVLRGRSPIKGSCGGLDTLSRLGLDCSGCSEPCDPNEKEICQSSRHHVDTPHICRPEPASARR